MITRLFKITGTSKFQNYNFKGTSTWNGEFKKTNLIYGENGSGKTTLSIILHSLKGNNALLTKIQNFNKNIPQEIGMNTDSTINPIICFKNSKWDNNIPNIEIFDTHFINDNIYTGFEISNDHKKNLLEIVFGERGIQLKEEIKKIKENITIINNNIREKGKEIEGLIDNAFTVETFCKKSKDIDIDNKVLNKEKEITAVNNSQEIKSKSSLKDISTISLPFSKVDIMEILNKSVEKISEKYLQLLNEHKQHLGMEEKTEQWIKLGFESIYDDKCPFCLRTLDNTIDIIEAYKKYFNKEYNELKNKIKDFNFKINNFNIEALLLDIENKVSYNNNLITFWMQYINHKIPLNFEIKDKEGLIDIFNKAKKEINNKDSNPVESQDSTNVVNLLTSITNINEEINKLNKIISVINTSINNLKNKPVSNQATLEKELKELKALKKLSEDNIKNLCIAYNNKKNEKDELDLKKSKKQKELDIYSAEILNKYSDKINSNLKNFANYLSIKNLDSSYIGASKEPMIKFALFINGNEISIDDKDNKPSFKYSFSEGDKSSLALAFFLAKLEVDYDLQDKIIVFDDPVSSFDLSRKTTTINKLLSFGSRSNQLFVFTHNIHFASEFLKNTKRDESACFKIEFINNSSVITDFNINENTLNYTINDLILIDDFIRNGTYDEHRKRAIARSIRPSLESYFHLKYYNIVKENEWLGNFISKIRDSDISQPISRLKEHLSEFEDINSYSKQFHHRFNPNAENVPINNQELQTFCQRTLNLIQII